MMIQLKKSKALLAAAALLITSTGLAQQATTDTKAARQRVAPSSKATTASATRTVSGTISDVRDVKVRGGAETNKVVLLETAKGKRIAVDLGAASKLQDVEVKKGSPLTVKGQIVRIQAKPVLMADALTAGDKQLQVKRSGKARKQGKAQQPKQFSGELTNVREVKVKGFEQPHKVAILKINNDKQLYLDLGPADQLQQKKLVTGAQVSVKGSPMKINGHAVLAVTQLLADGETIQIKRERKQKTQQM